MSQVVGHDRGVEERLDALASLLAERRLLGRLVAAGDALAIAEDSARIGAVLVENLLDAFNAPAAALFVRDGDRLRAEAVGGVSAPVRDAWTDLPGSGIALPVVVALETGEIVTVATRAELEARFPAVTSLPARTGLDGAAAFVPLVAADRRLGVLLLRFAEERAFSPGELGFLRSFAHQAALALARVDSLQVARVATAEAQAAAERAAFLARASEVLGRSVDDRTTLQELADLGVPTLADWCFVTVLDETGRVEATASASAFPGGTALAERAARFAPAQAGRSTATVLETLEPLLVADVAADGLVDEAADDAHLAVLRELAPRSILGVPLLSHGRAFGSVAFVAAGSGRRYGAADVALGTDVARRAAAAIENGRLYADVRRARERAESLARASDLLAQSTDRTVLLGRLAELAVVTFADWCFINIPDDEGVLRCAVAAARLPEDRALAERSLGRAVVDPAFTDGRSLRWERLDDEDLAELARRDGSVSLDYLHELGPGSAIAVPVRGRGGILGSLSLIARRDRAPYGPSDIDHAEQLAWRTAVAIENARLYQDLRRLAVVEQARASELEAVIQAVGDPMVVCDRDGHVRLANEAAVRAFEGEVPPTFAGIRARFEDADELPDLADLGGDGPDGDGRGGGPVELRLRGTDRWLELTRYPVPASFGASDDGPELLVGSSILLLRDVTAIRRAEELREAFIGVLSHELRTPITTIYGGTRVLAREGVGEETRREIATDVTAEAERLHRLVEDLLVLARAERETMDLGGDPVLLQHLVPRVLRTEEPRWPEASFALSAPASVPAVSGDETYVEQVVRNLVGNAAKYGAGIGQVEVVIEGFEDEVVVRVLDEGPGFSSDESDQLFELFYRGATTSSSTSGAGIGLFVCRALVEAMGGRIWAHPRPAGGAEFGFALPVFAEDD